jgi:peptidoglycan/xylan/chitin deacetylase (PgdA/CDA1 family)
MGEVSAVDARDGSDRLMRNGDAGPADAGWGTVRGAPYGRAIGPVPILLYHSVSNDPDAWIRRFAVAPGAFSWHLDLIAAHGATTLTVSAFVDARTLGGAALPERPVLITFDDGFADFGGTALRALREREMVATLYPATDFVGRRSPGGAPMLGWDDLCELGTSGDVEVGGHTVTHPQLDAIPAARARVEIAQCKATLEDRLGTPVRSFAYPHGYSSAAVRAIVREEGYDSACAVKNAFSSVDDDRFALARLTVRADTPIAVIDAWLAGREARLAPRRELARTRAGRIARRVRVQARRRVATAPHA